MSIFPFAYTKLKAFETCPRQAYARYISKTYPFEETEAMRKGKEVHKILEEYVRDALPLPADYLWLRQYVPDRTTDTLVLEPELSLGIDRDNNPVSFYDSDCWFRGKVDLLDIEGDTAFLVDWKTGKPYEDPDELNLHAMLVKGVYPCVKHWRGFYVWLRDRKIGECHTLSPARTYHKLLSRVDNLKIEDIPRKNALCGWCNIKKCEFKP